MIRALDKAAAAGITIIGGIAQVSGLFSRRKALKRLPRDIPFLWSEGVRKMIPRNLGRSYRDNSRSQEISLADVHASMA
jgi:hypothetical protein